MITIKEMAEMLGISTTTVSNVINGKTSEVSQKTAEKVQKLLDEYDYVPNMNAKNLAQNHSRLIGIVLKRKKDKYDNIFTDPFHGELLGSLEAAIRERGYYMMLYTSEDIDEIVRNVVSWNTEGLILIGMLHDDYLKIRSKYKKPAVLIDSYTPKNIARYVNIGLDDEEGGYLITRMTHNARNGIAKRCPAAMTDMHRTRRIGRHILKVDVTRSTFRQRTLAEVETLCTHTSSNRLERGRRQLNVDETRTCDLDRCDHVVFGQMINDNLRNLARIFVGQLCCTHGNGRSPIAIG